MSSPERVSPEEAPHAWESRFLRAFALYEKYLFTPLLVGILAWWGLWWMVGDPPGFIGSPFYYAAISICLLHYPAKWAGERLSTRQS